MAFSLSPAVNVSEIDLTTVVPAVSTTEGAIAGVFRWGPADQALLISSENELVKRYGKPTTRNFETWFTAASFLSYGNALYVSRAVDANTFNAVANTGAVSNTQITNLDDYQTTTLPIVNALYLAKYPGTIGNGLKISVCDSSNAYSSSVGTPSDANNTVSFEFGVGQTTGTLRVINSAGSNTSAETDASTILAAITVGDKLQIGNTSIGSQYVGVVSKATPVAIANGTVTATITLDTRVSTSANVAQASVTRLWEFFQNVNSAPGTSTYAASRGVTGDELHVVVVDQNGDFTGTQGQILEIFEGLSRGTDAKGEQGGSLYYRDVLNQSSNYLWWAGDRTGAASALTGSVVASTNVLPFTMTMGGGTDSADESTIAISSLTKAYDKFKSSEQIDVSLILAGKARGGTNSEQVANYLIDNLAEYRKDCMVFVSPDRADVVNNAAGDPAADVVTFRQSLRSTSYAVLDSGYKYMYDRYNDVYRYVPLNGDIAGLCVYTDSTRDPWWSPAGFNRGQIKNVVKLAYNPERADRDVLYKNGVNPVVSFPGQGVVLFGDKTLLAKPSAFDRINVRRLFIVLEKAIAIASKFTLFEFNDEFTRAQFRNMVEPYLRDVQGRRGIYDFKVICDETNNTAEVIDHNQFVGDIYVKPARSINFIQLNFVAVRTGVEFSEVVGNVN